MPHPTPEKPVVVGITGASGSALADAVIDRLLAMQVPVVATASSAARMVWREEMDESFGAALERWDAGGSFAFHQVGDLRAPIASGTYPTLGMVIVPCSMATAAAVAHGLADNLVRRAADVCIKERRPLVIVPRESPLSAIHLRNLAELAQLGRDHTAARARLLPAPTHRQRRDRVRRPARAHCPRRNGRPPARHAVRGAAGVGVAYGRALVVLEGVDFKLPI